MRRNILGLVACMMTLVSIEVPAQALHGTRLGISTAETARGPSLVTSRPRTGSHWMTGAIVGTAVGATAVALYAGTQGEGRFGLGDALISLGLGALIGGVPGALIGGLFPKHEPEAESEAASRASGSAVDRSLYVSPT